MAGQTFPAPGGFTITMDETNHHLHKPVFIGEIKADGQFNVVWKTPARCARSRGARSSPATTSGQTARAEVRSEAADKALPLFGNSAHDVARCAQRRSDRLAARRAARRTLWIGVLALLATRAAGTGGAHRRARSPPTRPTRSRPATARAGSPRCGARPRPATRVCRCWSRRCSTARCRSTRSAPTSWRDGKRRRGRQRRRGDAAGHGRGRHQQQPHARRAATRAGGAEAAFARDRERGAALSALRDSTDESKLPLIENALASETDPTLKAAARRAARRRAGQLGRRGQAARGARSARRAAAAAPRAACCSSA